MEFSRFLYASVKYLTLEERGELFTAILALTNGDDVCVTSPVVRVAFAPFEEEYREHEEMVESHRNRGRMGGAPAGNQNARKQAKTSKNKLNQAKNNLVDLVDSEEKSSPEPLSKEESVVEEEKSILNRIEKEEETTPTPEAKTPERKVFKPPTADEVREYCGTKEYRIDPEEFVDFYESKGWMVGKTKMKDWRAAVRTWVKRRNDFKDGNGNNKIPGRIGQEQDRQRVYEDSF